MYSVGLGSGHGYCCQKAELVGVFVGTIWRGYSGMWIIIIFGVKYASVPGYDMICGIASVII